MDQNIEFKLYSYGEVNKINSFIEYIKDLKTDNS